MMQHLLGRFEHDAGLNAANRTEMTETTLDKGYYV